MNPTTEQKPVLNHDEIAELAQQIWQTEGCQAGRDEEYWLKAEQQILAAKQQKSCPASQINGVVTKRNSPSATGKKSGKM